MQINLKKIVLREIKNRYKTERIFYEEILKVKKGQWKYWRNNEFNLIDFENKIISKLFTDYEWELANKIVNDYSEGIGISDYYSAYIDLKVERMLCILSDESKVAVKDIDPNQKHAEEKYRVPKIRLYIGDTKGRIVSLIIHNKMILDMPGNKKFLAGWIRQLGRNNIPKGE